MTRIQSILVATDFSAEAGLAARRAASIGREAGAHMRLVHVLPSSLPAELHVQFAELAQQALAVAVEELRQEGVQVEPRLLSGNVAGELARAASDFDLVVAGAHGQSLLRDFALGRTSVHLVRESWRPVLIVKRPAQGPYRRVVAAVDFSERSYEAAVCATRIAPKAGFDLVHAYEVEFESTLRLAEAREEKIEAYRQEAHQKAMHAMNGFAHRLGLSAGLMATFVTRGYPPKVILDRAEAAGADLIVLGKHASGVIEHALIGSVALQVLEMADCDVLVFPGN